MDHLLSNDRKKSKDHKKFKDNLFQNRKIFHDQNMNKI